MSTHLLQLRQNRSVVYTLYKKLDAKDILRYEYACAIVHLLQLRQNRSVLYTLYKKLDAKDILRYEYASAPTKAKQVSFICKQHRRRIQTDKKAKVVATVLGGRIY